MKYAFIKESYLVILFIFPLNIVAQTSKHTIKDILDKIQETYNVMFVYDSDINLNIESNAINISREKKLDLVLAELLKNTQFVYQQKGDYIILFKRRIHTFSGFVLMDNGEKVINATIYNLTMGDGTITNEHGFFSMNIPEGKHIIRISHIGAKEIIKEFDIKKDCIGTYILYSGHDLGEIVITTDLSTPLNSTQTGKISLSGKEFDKDVYFMSTPDIIKKFQKYSGISSGTELLSGLYVHGGNGDENRILLDGTPLYHINHLFGLFSAFNTDIIKNVEFYKSGFPARYGGRLSSVIDIRTNSGSYTEYHGKLTLSPLEGRLQFEGPIIKERSSFNISMRRSLIDLLMLSLNINDNNENNKNTTQVLYHDINAKFSSKIKEKTQVEINFYSGNDYIKLNDEMKFSRKNIIDQDNFKIKWGNLATSVSLRYIFSPKMFSNFMGIYSKNISNYIYNSMIQEEDDDYRIEKKHSNDATINDYGYRCEFDYTPARFSRMKFGSNFTFHIFKPQDVIYYSKDEHYSTEPKVDIKLSKKYHSKEFILYCENEIKVNKRFKFNAGIHYNTFITENRSYHSLQPRLSLNFYITDDTSFKMSLSKMSQNMHLLSGSYLNLSTDCWVPSTEKVSPSQSWQLSCGIYKDFFNSLNLNVELYYKTLSNILLYTGDERLSPTVIDWENNLTVGKGKSYGIEIDYRYKYNKLEARGAYTLSWSKRFFPEIYNGWYWDKFDNRHKFNIVLSYFFNKKLDLYASWTLRNGNKFTLPEKYVSAPILPGIDDVSVDQFIYGEPNNMSMPTYHRLDLGANFKYTTKRKFEHIWNVSVYNAYLKKNAFYIEFFMKENGRFAWKPHSIIPILPSISYTFKF